MLSFWRAEIYNWRRKSWNPVTWVPRLKIGFSFLYRKVYQVQGFYHLPVLILIYAFKQQTIDGFLLGSRNGTLLEEPAEKSFSGEQVPALLRIFSRSLTHSSTRGTSIFGDCSRKEPPTLTHWGAHRKVIFRLARSRSVKLFKRSMHYLFSTVIHCAAVLHKCWIIHIIQNTAAYRRCIWELQHLAIEAINCSALFSKRTTRKITTLFLCSSVMHLNMRSGIIRVWIRTGRREP